MLGSTKEEIKQLIKPPRYSLQSKSVWGKYDYIEYEGTVLFVYWYTSTYWVTIPLELLEEGISVDPLKSAFTHPLVIWREDYKSTGRVIISEINSLKENLPKIRVNNPFREEEQLEFDLDE